ncbi:MAG: hypothetical protein SWY16_04630 [Cyanobacteriota bacterium]|nr:hypothetical protein [Cyanobacteriota bacterium]
MIKNILDRIICTGELGNIVEDLRLKDDLNEHTLYELRVLFLYVCIFSGLALSVYVYFEELEFFYNIIVFVAALFFGKVTSFDLVRRIVWPATRGVRGKATIIHSQYQTGFKQIGHVHHPKGWEIVLDFELPNGKKYRRTFEGIPQKSYSSKEEEIIDVLYDPLNPRCFIPSLPVFINNYCLSKKKAGKITNAKKSNLLY